MTWFDVYLGCMSVWMNSLQLCNNTSNTMRKSVCYTAADIVLLSNDSLSANKGERAIHSG